MIIQFPRNTREFIRARLIDDFGVVETATAARISIWPVNELGVHVAPPLVDNAACFVTGNEIYYLLPAAVTADIGRYRAKITVTIPSISETPVDWCDIIITEGNP